MMSISRTDNMNNLIITEIFLKKNCEHGRVFRFPIDPLDSKPNSLGDLFCRKSRRGINVFFHGMKNRNRKKGEILYHSCIESEHAMSLKITQEFIPNWPTPKYIDVKSVWDFFKEVGYDYKNKKWKFN